MKRSWLTAPATVLAVLMMLPVMAVAAPDLVDVCHYTAGSAPEGHMWKRIRVSAKSVQKHLGHGDVLAGHSIPESSQVLDHDCNTVDTDPEGPPEAPEPPTSDPGQPSETVFAVAYSDADPTDGGYNPAVDVLISKLIDGPDAANDGVPGAGDLIITGQFPTDFAMNTHGSFAVGAHTITSFAPGGYVCTASTLDGFFVWSTGQGSFDQYQEWSSADTITRLYDERSSGTGQEDQILITQTSPSQPSVHIALSDSDLSDQAFIDVEVTCSG